MNSTRNLQTRAADHVVRIENGGIDYEYYRNRALQERARAVRAAIAWLSRRLSAPSTSRRVEVDWRPEAGLNR